MSGGGLALFLAVFAVIALIVTSTEDKPQTPRINNPDPSTAPLIAESVSHSMWTWVGFIAAGAGVGVAFSVAAGTLALHYPRWRWHIWAALAASTMGGWLLVAQHVLWFNAVTGGCVTIAVVVVMDFTWGGRRASAPPPRRARTDTKDESWRDVIPESVVLGQQAPRQGPERPRTWRDWDRLDRNIQAGADIISMAERRGMTPDELAQGIRDFRLAQDRWEDTINGAVPASPVPAATPGRDLSDEIRDTGWDAFLAATPMRLVHSTTDPGNDGRDVVLYEITTGPWAGERVLQVIDASREDGINRRVGIPVGRDHADAGAALADTWGLTPEQYAPIRHT